MAIEVARLVANLSADTRDFDKAMVRSESTMGKVGKAAGLAGAAIATGVLIGAKRAIAAASPRRRQSTRRRSRLAGRPMGF